MDESWTLVINLAKTDTYILVQKSMLHLFPLISARRLNPQTHEHTNERTNIFGLLYWLYLASRVHKVTASFKTFNRLL